LKSSNEELLSVNEEMQSTNEELHTVNSDRNIKMEALDQANSDLRNLFESTDIATLFLDEHLVIRSFTPAMTKIFNLRPVDHGRPLKDLSAQFSLTNLSEDIAATLAGRGPIERRIAHAGQQCSLSCPANNPCAAYRGSCQPRIMSWRA
jgi:two-component system CheB/CheR fusion protein